MHAYAYNDENYLNKDDKNIILKDTHVNFMDRDKIEQFQQVSILGQANPDNK
jgi:hypothetical protein